MRLYAIPAIAFLSACTLQPRYQRPAAPVAAHYPAFGAAKPEETGWRDFFADPRLQALIDIALRNNRDLRIAALKVEQTRAQYQIARAAFIPALQVQSGAERSRIPESVSPTGQSMTRGQYSIGAGIAWEIDFFGKLHSLKDAALAAYLSTAHACRAAEIALVAQLAKQYLTLRAFDEQLKVTQDALAAALESERLVKLRVDAGVASALDLTDAESAAARARTNEQNQLRARAQAENALVLLLGQPLPDNLPPAAALDPQGILADLPAGVPSDLLTRRPDIMAAEEMLRAANAQIGAARAAFFPSISLTGQYGMASAALSGLFKAGALAWAFSPNIALPIFRGGAHRAQLDAARVGKKIAVAQYEKTIQTAFREVADALAARATDAQHIAALEQTIAAQRRRLKLSTLRYQHGIDGYARVLAAQTDLYAARQALIAAHLARWANLVDLYRALGGGWRARRADV
ncbi:Outer membrane efflux protein OprB [Candidatus Glomeribacter gigasporarum BEG34]|uniref:Outer membrane efflux protein OprB n=1 Tax=Candidatus Glomeribacter gigasporarum BEG34 TaxID=1070319 RepID=G2J7Y7_9BURK|nr:efflux transporter outer membrane subunit [Candidatus Glomeribacter gigasporarum]CCD28884.1 Outer membrane efflux protein OprB [Candidatus Glomeribacter gigasporarum BEG34]